MLLLGFIQVSAFPVVLTVQCQRKPSGTIHGLMKHDPFPRPLASILRTVLVVENDDLTRETMVYMLEAMGYVTVSASTEERAFDLLQKVQVHVMLISLTLGDPSGEDLSAKAKILQSHLKVIVVSGYAPPSVLTKSIDGYVQKPFEMATIKLEIMKVMATLH